MIHLGDGFAGLAADGQYRVIYADPPWWYNNRHTTDSIGACRHYPLMRTEEICALPVAHCCADNCILFLWATWPTLTDALMVIEAWGFRYCTCGFAWVKTVGDSSKPFFGIGYYTKSNTEVCLIGVKGSMPPAVNDVSQVIMSPRREHSRKPDRARYLIEQMYPDVPRLEMFARERAPGWDAWGNQTELRPQQETLFPDSNTVLAGASARIPGQESLFQEEP